MFLHEVYAKAKRPLCSSPLGYVPEFGQPGKSPKIRVKFSNP